MSPSIATLPLEYTQKVVSNISEFYTQPNFPPAKRESDVAFQPFIHGEEGLLNTFSVVTHMNLRQQNCLLSNW